LPVGRARRAGGGRKAGQLAGPRSGRGAVGVGGAGRTRRPDVPIALDDEVAAASGRGTYPTGSPVSPATVGRLLRENGSGLQGTAKTLEGEQHPDRDAKFRYINEQVRAHQDAGEPVISVDAKKEQLGQLPAAGREWRPKGDPVRVEDHSFFIAGPDTEHAIPTASMTSPRIAVGSMSASTTTPPRSPWRRSAAGGPRAGHATIRAPAGC
jgi:DDE family transposase